MEFLNTLRNTFVTFCVIPPSVVRVYSFIIFLYVPSAAANSCMANIIANAKIIFLFIGLFLLKNQYSVCHLLECVYRSAELRPVRSLVDALAK